MPFPKLAGILQLIGPHFSVPFVIAPLLQLYSFVPDKTLYPVLHFTSHFFPEDSKEPTTHGDVSPPTTPVPNAFGKEQPFGLEHFNVAGVNLPPAPQVYWVDPLSESCKIKKQPGIFRELVPQTSQKITGKVWPSAPPWLEPA